MRSGRNSPDSAAGRFWGSSYGSSPRRHPTHLLTSIAFCVASLVLESCMPHAAIRDASLHAGSFAAGLDRQTGTDGLPIKRPGGGSEYEKQIRMVRDLDACMRRATPELRSVHPHDLRFEDLRHSVGQARRTRGCDHQAGRARQTCRYITVLDIRALVSPTLHMRRAVHVALSHEYVHHLHGPDLVHGRLFDSKVDKLRARTTRCIGWRVRTAGLASD